MNLETFNKAKALIEKIQNQNVSIIQLNRIINDCANNRFDKVSNTFTINGYEFTIRNEDLQNILICVRQSIREMEVQNQTEFRNL